MFVLKGRGSSMGLFSIEGDWCLIRIFNDDVNLLRQACDEVASFLAKYAAQNKKQLDFSKRPIEIREDGKEENVIVGRVITDKSEQRHVARREKRIEYYAALAGIILLVVLLAITFPWYDQSGLNPKLRWLLDIAQKMIGSTIITSALSYLSYRTHLAHLRKHHVLWAIPGDPALAQIDTPRSG